jgi:hypothetical protein
MKKNFMTDPFREDKYLTIVEDIIGKRLKHISQPHDVIYFKFQTYSDNVWNYTYEDEKTIYQINICVDDNCESFFDEEDLWDLFCKKEIGFFDYTIYHKETSQRIKQEVLFKKAVL